MNQIIHTAVCPKVKYTSLTVAICRDKCKLAIMS